MSGHWGQPGFWRRERQSAGHYGHGLAVWLVNYLLLLVVFVLLTALCWPLLAHLSSNVRAAVFGGGFWLSFAAMRRGWLPRIRWPRR